MKSYTDCVKGAIMKKILVVYSSRTGNTQKVAEAMYHTAEDRCVLKKVEEAGNIEEYDLIFIGYWVDKGGPDEATQKFLRTLRGKKIVLFQTLGAAPDSDHALGCFGNAGKYLSEDNHVLGALSIWGAVDPKLIEVMMKNPAGHVHAPSPERIARWKAASTHPDATDLEKAAACMRRYVDMFDTFYSGDRRGGKENSAN